MTSDNVQHLQQISSTLAAALITVSGRPHSVNEAIQLMKDVQFSLAPNPSSGAYAKWQAEFDGDKPHT
ncbi:hypothetical protein [Rhizobium sp. AAP43]|uniref:hypothetical protein n=1 Tax=Rhizobium sp. AAP43 TaxID=1523420 RepID=UPI000A51185C|nr:hypothetical protein [Rhizobium sp. AAP43]